MVSEAFTLCMLGYISPTREQVNKEVGIKSTTNNFHSTVPFRIIEVKKDGVLGFAVCVKCKMYIQQVENP